jgi:hypothetical protein
MKKVLMVAVSLLLLVGNVCFAGDLGNPATLIGGGQFDVGFQWTESIQAELRGLRSQKKLLGRVSGQR